MSKNASTTSETETGISSPGKNDVMFGRGGGTNNHIGNIRFRQLVNEHKFRYLAAPKTEKPKIARELVGLWRKLDPPGRFLVKKCSEEKGKEFLWFDVGDRKAREKTSQCLRERTPDVLPFVNQLKMQQYPNSFKQTPTPIVPKVAPPIPAQEPPEPIKTQMFFQQLQNAHNLKMIQTNEAEKMRAAAVAVALLDTNTAPGEDNSELKAYLRNMSQPDPNYGTNYMKNFSNV